MGDFTLRKFEDSKLPITDYEGNEVDYILEKNGVTVAIKVKSNADRTGEGLENFRKRFSPRIALVVGKGGVGAEEFLSSSPEILF